MPDSKQVAADVVVLTSAGSSVMPTDPSGALLEEHRILDPVAGDGDEAVIGVSRCCVDCESDGKGIGPVLQKADALIDQGERHLVLNFQGIDELGGDDVKELRRVQGRCSSLDGMLGLCEISEHVADELRGFDVAISTYDTEEEAVTFAGGLLRALLQRESQLSKISVVVHELDLEKDISEAEFLTSGPGDEWTSRPGELVLIQLQPGQEEALQPAVQPLISHGLHHLVVDLTAVRDGDAKSVLQSVDKAAGALQTWGGGVALVNVDSTVSALLDAMDYSEGLDVLANVDVVVDLYKERLLESRFEETQARSSVGSGDGAEVKSSADSFDVVAGVGEADTTQALEALAAKLEFIDLEVGQSDFVGLAAAVQGHLDAGKRHFTVRIRISRRLKVDEIEQLSAVNERVAATGGFLSLVDLPEEVSTWFVLLDLDKQFSVQADLSAARLAQARLARDNKRLEKEQAEQAKLDEVRKQQEWSDLLETLPEIEREKIELVEDAAGAEGRLYRAVDEVEDGERHSVRVSMIDVTAEGVGGLLATAQSLVAAGEDHVVVNLHELGDMRGKRINALLESALALSDAGRQVAFCEPGVELTHLRKLMGFEKEILLYATESDALFGIALALFGKEVYSELELTSRRVPLKEPPAEVEEPVAEVEESSVEPLESEDEVEESSVEALESEDEVEESSVEALESEDEVEESSVEALESEAEASGEDVPSAEVVDAETESVQIETADAPSETVEVESEPASADGWAPVEISETAMAFLGSLPVVTAEALQSLLGRGNSSVGALLERAAELGESGASSVADASVQEAGEEAAAAATEELESLRAGQSQLLDQVSELEGELENVRLGRGEVEAALTDEKSARQQLEERNALSEKEKRELQAEIEDSAGGLDRAREEVRLANEELEKSREELVQARGDLEQARSDAKRASEKLEQVSGETLENKEALEQARGDADQARSEAAKADEALEEARAEVAKAGEALEEARAEVQQVKEDAATAGKSLEEARAEVDQAKAEAVKAGEELEGARAEVEAAQADAVKAGEALEEARVEVGKAQADAITAGEALQEARAEVDQARAEAVQAGETLKEARTEAEQVRLEASAAGESLEEARAEFEEARATDAEKADEALEKVKADAATVDEALAAVRGEAEKAQEDAAASSTRLEQVREETSSKVQEAEEEVDRLKAEVVRLTDDLAAAEELFEEQGSQTSAVAEASREPSESAQLEHSQRNAQQELARLRGLEVLLREKLGVAQREHAQLQKAPRVSSGETAAMAHERAQIIADAKSEIERLQHDKEVLREELESAGEMIERLGKELELG